MRPWQALILISLSGCALHLRVTHELKVPIRCAVLRDQGEMGFRCAPEKPREPEQAPHPGEGVPPL